MQARIETQPIGIINRHYRVTVSATTPSGIEVTVAVTRRSETEAESLANHAFDVAWAEATR